MVPASIAPPLLLLPLLPLLLLLLLLLLPPLSPPLLLLLLLLLLVPAGEASVAASVTASVGHRPPHSGPAMLTLPQAAATAAPHAAHKKIISFFIELRTSVNFARGSRHGDSHFRSRFLASTRRAKPSISGRGRL